MKAAEASKRAKRTYTRSGLYSLRATLQVLGGRAIDRRTALGQAHEAWRESLIADLGGREELSVQRLALVDLALKSKLLLDSVDAWLLNQKSLVDKRRRCLLPVVRERTALASSFQSVLRDLGLERKAKPLRSLAELLAQHTAQEPAQAEQQQPVEAEAVPVEQDAAQGDVAEEAAS
jgi:hypothetical protein